MSEDFLKTNIEYHHRARKNFGELPSLVVALKSYDKIRKGEYYYCFVDSCDWEFKDLLGGHNGYYKPYAPKIKAVFNIPETPEDYKDGSKLLGKEFKCLDDDKIYKVVELVEDNEALVLIADEHDAVFAATKFWLKEYTRPLDSSLEPPEWLKPGTLVFYPDRKAEGDSTRGHVYYISSITHFNGDNEPRVFLENPKTGDYFSPRLSEVIRNTYPIGVFKDYHGMTDENDDLDGDVETEA